MSKIECGKLHGERFSRRHSILQSHGLFALAKPLYIVALALNCPLLLLLMSLFFIRQVNIIWKTQQINVSSPGSVYWCKRQSSHVVPLQHRYKKSKTGKEERDKMTTKKGQIASPVQLSPGRWLLQELAIASSRTPLAALTLSVSVTSKYLRECSHVEIAAGWSRTIIRRIIEIVRRLKPCI